MSCTKHVMHKMCLSQMMSSTKCVMHKYLMCPVQIYVLYNLCPTHFVKDTKYVLNSLIMVVAGFVSCTRTLYTCTHESYTCRVIDAISPVCVTLYQHLQIYTVIYNR
jgi:hypothetical protein